MNFERTAIILGVSNPNFTNNYENLLLMILHLLKYCFIIGMSYIHFGSSVKENGEIGIFMMKLFRVSISLTEHQKFNILANRAHIRNRHDCHANFILRKGATTYSNAVS